MDRKLAWVALNALPSLTPRRLRLLLRSFGDPRAILAAEEGELAGAIGPEAARRLVIERARFDPECELIRAEKAGARVVTVEDAAYPEPLRRLPDPPLVLYILGELTAEEGRALAIVGTRRATSYGRLVARGLAEELAARGVTVVSGMAPGIDTAAHRGALAAGRTVAVLGTGLGRPYPAGAVSLMEEIAARGAVISEFPWEREGSKWTFPRRNRIIAGLARGVIVVEAPERSGALITAELALEQGKEVFAVPGPVTSEVSRGTNRLIQEGAKLVMDVEDVLEEFPDLRATPSRGEEPGVELEDEARVVYEALAGEPLNAEEIAGKTGLPYALVTKVLLELSLAGLVRECPGGRYLRMSLG
ncbi:DNA-processing protein DprA [Candidatus Bipolaricaulota sp. J31]